MADGMARVQGRKWQITINNPQEHGFDHEKIKSALHQFKGLLYFCLCDEEGDECKTRHTHVFFVLRNPCTAERVNKLFPNFHRERMNGTCAENRAYILKDGEKFNKQPDGSYHYTDASGKDHDGINFSDTFEEEGEMPQEHQGKSRDADVIVDMLKNGASNVEIVGIICLDFNNRIINYANVATGNIATVKASVAQICKIALLSNASKVIVAHNHPDGCLKITDEDVTMTRKMAAALKLFDIQLMDSMIVNPNGEVVSIRKYVESKQ